MLQIEFEVQTTNCYNWAFFYIRPTLIVELRLGGRLCSARSWKFGTLTFDAGTDPASAVGRRQHYPQKETKQAGQNFEAFRSHLPILHCTCYRIDAWAIRRPWLTFVNALANSILGRFHTARNLMICFVLLQPLRWCCVDCVIHHERDVWEE